MPMILNNSFEIWYKSHSWDALIVQIWYKDSSIPTYDISHDFDRFSKHQNEGEGGGNGHRRGC